MGQFSWDVICNQGLGHGRSVNHSAGDVAEILTSPAAMVYVTGTLHKPSVLQHKVIEKTLIGVIPIEENPKDDLPNILCGLQTAYMDEQAHDRISVLLGTDVMWDSLCLNECLRSISTRAAAWR